MSQIRPKLGAIAVVIHDGRALLVRRKNEPDAGKWGFAGGHVEWGETAFDAAARELEEETGVLATALRYLTNVDVILRDDAGDVTFHCLLAAVECRYESGTPFAADDVNDAAWFAIEDVAALDKSDRVDEMIRLVSGSNAP
ncbi:NUDIX hydrolase [Yoonia sp. 2307UL14-13]|uniref:NUDIX hydrolase n=1 Tax=Yoonia sp. 2307UL14-13 TaxID=3126506 RepID=UPI003096C46C